MTLSTFFYAWAWVRATAPEDERTWRDALRAPWLAYRYALRDPISLCAIAAEARREDTGNMLYDAACADIARRCEDRAESMHPGVVRKFWSVRQRALDGEDSAAVIADLRAEVGDPGGRG